MFVERRDTLFGFTDILQLLIRAQPKISKHVPSNIGTYRIRSARTVDEIKQNRHRFKAFFEYVDTDTPRDLVFFILEDVKGNDVHMFVPQDIVLELLIEKFIENRIPLPKNSRKEIVTDDHMLGVRMIINNSELSLADD